MLVLLAVISLVAFAQSATLLPVDSSSVNVKQSGHDYSYTIQENHGIAIEPLPHRQIPVIKIAPENNLKHEHLPIKEQEVKPLQHIKTTQIHYSPVVYYLPAHQYGIPYAYGVNYPYNLIGAF